MPELGSTSNTPARGGEFIVTVILDEYTGKPVSPQQLNVKVNTIPLTKVDGEIAK